MSRPGPCRHETSQACARPPRALAIDSQGACWSTHVVFRLSYFIPARVLMTHVTRLLTRSLTRVLTRLLTCLLTRLTRLLTSLVDSFDDSCDATHLLQFPSGASCRPSCRKAKQPLPCELVLAAGCSGVLCSQGWVFDVLFRSSCSVRWGPLVPTFSCHLKVDN